MEPVTIHSRHYIWAGLLLLIICGAAGFALGRASYVFLGIFVCMLFLALGSQKVVVSVAGIETYFLKWKTLYPWEQVIQAGIMNISYHGSSGPHLLVTLKGGRPKTPGQGFSDWFSSNPKGLKIPCVEGLRELVRTYYGPLDFDSSPIERKTK